MSQPPANRPGSQSPRFALPARLQPASAPPAMYDRRGAATFCMHAVGRGHAGAANRPCCGW